jgi:phosphonate transport system substrate-binding protein
MKKLSFFFAVLFVLTMILPVAAQTEIGTEDNPIKVLFVPSVEANTIVTGGEIMAKALHDATGYFFEVSVPTSFAATVEEMCASPDNTMGFIPAKPYVMASELCGVDVAFAALRYGFKEYWAEFIVRRDSGIEKLEDLAGKTWAYPDASSTSGYTVPAVMFKEMGIEVGDTVEAGGHPQTVKAVYNGEADFGTVFYSAFRTPEGVEPWKYGDEPDIPADLIDSCVLTEDGKDIDCGGYVVKDARANIREEAPDVIQQVGILALSASIPNDTLSFGPDFPADIRTKIEDALVAFSKTPEWAESIGNPDFYDWTGLEKTEDSNYDITRLMVAALGETLDDFR